MPKWFSIGELLPKLVASDFHTVHHPPLTGHRAGDLHCSQIADPTTRYSAGSHRKEPGLIVQHFQTEFSTEVVVVLDGLPVPGTLYPPNF